MPTGPTLKRTIPGQAISASGLNRAASELERVTRLRGPGVVSSGAGVSLVPTEPDWVLARIGTSYGSGQYAWSEYYLSDANDGTAERADAGRFGDDTNNLAFEVNQNASVPEGTLVQLWPGRGFHWLFEYQDASGSADELVKVSANDTTSGYLNGKLLPGTSIFFTENDDGSDETLTIDSDYWVVHTATLGSSQHNYDAGAASILRLSCSASLSLTGLVFNTGFRFLVVSNVNPGSNLTLVNDSGLSSANNRILTDTGADLILRDRQQALLWYDSGTSRWRASKFGDSLYVDTVDGSPFSAQTQQLTFEELEGYQLSVPAVGQVLINNACYVRVSLDDTTPGYLEDKIVDDNSDASRDLTLAITTENDGANENLVVQANLLGAHDIYLQKLTMQQGDLFFRVWDSGIVGLEIVLAGAVTTNELVWWLTYWSTPQEIESSAAVGHSTMAPGSRVGETNGTTPVYLYEEDGPTIKFRVRSLVVRNADTVAATFALVLTNGVDDAAPYAVTLDPGDHFIFIQGHPPVVLDLYGARKGVAV
jgi:hypothetical protein